MAINAATIWEVRTTGSSLAGGGFADLDPGVSVDYSQQPLPQLTLSDVATISANPVVTSATGGFTPQMVGNVCLLYVPGFYYFVQIVEYIDTNTVRMDRAAAGTGSNR
ncbi:hypothetical protein M0R72_08715, partial [Candidatus Pacearchaeota archaeon]|nr:hypothetical protein [Candidatus Pacearchaeota archaeon]